MEVTFYHIHDISLLHKPLILTLSHTVLTYHQDKQSTSEKLQGKKHSMGLWISKLYGLFESFKGQQARILMLGLDAAGMYS